MLARLLLIFAIWLAGFSTEAKSPMVLSQVLTDDSAGVDGLDNPRNTLFSNNDKRVYVTSGDDNALAVFDVDGEFTLTFVQVLKNIQDDIDGLEGAMGMVHLASDTLVVTGFYDGAVSTFSASEQGLLQQVQVYRSKPDKSNQISLKGPWEVASGANGKFFIVAGYASNSVVQFDVAANKAFSVRQDKGKSSLSEHNFGSPVALTLSEDNSELFVLGYEGHILTVLALNEENPLTIKQVVQLNSLSGCLRPQKVILGQDSQTLYIACAESGSVIVLRKNAQGQLFLSQSISSEVVGTSALKGASSLAMTKDGQTLYVAGEEGQGILVFNVVSDGAVKLAHALTGEAFQLDSLAGISSLSLSGDDKYLLATQSKSDRLLVFRIDTDK